ncbi:MAG: hypothetical protein NT130_02590 [Candidatus Micrarchaeota archaeon]|nr:hypothetical protein [Candidatus Micrarchaeota archaeon]
MAAGQGGSAVALARKPMLDDIELELTKDKSWAGRQTVDDETRHVSVHFKEGGTITWCSRLTCSIDDKELSDVSLNFKQDGKLNRIEHVILDRDRLWSANIEELERKMREFLDTLPVKEWLKERNKTNGIDVAKEKERKGEQERFRKLMEELGPNGRRRLVH